MHAKRVIFRRLMIYIFFYYPLYKKKKNICIVKQQFLLSKITIANFCFNNMLQYRISLFLSILISLKYNQVMNQMMKKVLVGGKKCRRQNQCIKICYTLPKEKNFLRGQQKVFCALWARFCP